MKISAVIITKNEEKMIEDCLKSLTWVDEIVVIDGGSKDRTVEIAKKYKARIIEHVTDNYSDQRNYGLKEALGSWVFYIDADERVAPELRDEVLGISNFPARPAGGQFSISNSAYAIPRRNMIFGKEFKHGGQWPDYVKRLFKKSELVKWGGELHEEPVFKGNLGHLKNSLRHIKHENLAEMVEKTNRWSEIEAKLMFNAHHPPMNIIRFMTAMMREFWLRMVKQTAFLDGPEGIIYGIYQIFSRFISYAKLWEMQLNARSNI